MTVESNKRALDFNGVVPTTKKQRLGMGKTTNVPIMTGMLSPPVTPDKQRVIELDEQSLSQPKKLLLSTPPPTPTKSHCSLPSSSIYNRAKTLFGRSSVPHLGATLPCREAEAAKFDKYLVDKVGTLSSGSLYISGPPGTGKTAQTTATVHDFLIRHGKQKFDPAKPIHELEINGESRRVAYVQLNCMIIKKPEHIYTEICKKLVQTEANKRWNSQTLISLLTDTKVADISIVVLDELDNLMTGNQQILFDLFSYASSTLQKQAMTPKLILVGIANALDLTDRFLPRLRTNRINPDLLAFLPYTGDQIKHVIEQKLSTLSENGRKDVLIHPMAIQLCAKKTASNTGDLRKAFDICHQALETVEEQTRARLSSEELENLTVETAPKVSIAHVAKVCSHVFGTSNNDMGNKLRNLNLQQKTLLCSLVKFQEWAPRAKNTKNEFYEFYKTKIKLDNLIGFLKKGEFLEVLTTLESFGMVNSSSGMQKKNLELGLSKISMNVRKEDLLKAVEDISFLKQLLSSEL